SGIDTTLRRHRIAAMVAGTRPYLNGAGYEERQDEWTGMRPVAADGLPILGRLEPWRNVYVATGHSMLGVTLAPVTGRRMAELICTGAEPEVLKPFSPQRF